MSASFTDSKDLLAPTIHLIPAPFFSMSVIVLRCSARLGMNLLRKLIFPMKDCNSLMFLGCVIWSIPSTLYGSILIPFSDIMWPRSLPSCSPKTIFLGFRDRLYLLHFLKTFLRCFRCSSSVLEKTVKIGRAHV